MPDVHHNAEAVRSFNRFYTQQIGVLKDGLLDSPYSLTECRVLFELAKASPSKTARGGGMPAAAICAALQLDPGYLSRVLRRFEKLALVKRAASVADGRERIVTLTRKGRQEFTAIDTKSHDEAVALLERVTPERQGELIQALTTTQAILDPQTAPLPGVILRPHRAGDMGWVIERHAVLYEREYGWRMEALVAEIAVSFLKNFDAKMERCWIAERGGERLGSVFLVRKTTKVAQLRLLLLEPQARGIGLGKQLVGECVRFATEVGYHKIALWTQSVLEAATGIYAKAGFQLVEERKHRDLGTELVGQTWEKLLRVK